MDNYQLALHELYEKITVAEHSRKNSDAKHELLSSASKALSERISTLEDKIEYLETLKKKHGTYSTFKNNLPESKKIIFILSLISFITTFLFANLSAALVKTYFMDVISVANVILISLATATIGSAATLIYQLHSLKREEKILVDALDGTELNKVKQKLVRSKRQHRKLTNLKTHTDNKIARLDKRRAHLKKEIGEYHQAFDEIKTARSKACTQVKETNTYEELMNEAFNADEHTQEIIKRERKLEYDK